MDKFLLKLAGENKDFKSPEFRKKAGYFVSISGIILNLILSIAKVVIGVIINSITVSADAANNIFDTVSSLISLIGFKISGKPPDKEHPYGHGRVEYIAGLIISIMVIIIGIRFISSSVQRIIRPEKIIFDTVSFIILLMSIIVKLYIAYLNNHVGKLIDSKALKATALDAVGDVFTTLVVMVPMTASLFTDFNFDGYLGIAVSLMIIRNGIIMIKETVNPIIGENAPEGLLSDIENELMKTEGVKNIHDVCWHSYGAGNDYVTLDLQMPANMTIAQAHGIIDDMQRRIKSKYGVDISIHVEPALDEENKKCKVYMALEEIRKDCPEYENIYDFSIVNVGGKETVVFDMAVNTEKSAKTVEEIKKELYARLYEKIGDKYNYSFNILERF